MATPVERLEQTRACLREALRPAETARAPLTAAPILVTAHGSPGLSPAASGTSVSGNIDLGQGERPSDNAGEALAAIHALWLALMPARESPNRLGAPVDGRARGWLHLAGDVAAEVTRALLLPVAQRRPVSLVAGAAAAGAVVALIRPWRWYTHHVNTATVNTATQSRRSALLAPAAGVSVPSAIGSMLAAVPLGTWISLLQWTLKHSAKARAE